MLLALTVAADPLLLSGRCPVLEDLLLGAFLRWGISMCMCTAVVCELHVLWNTPKSLCPIH